MKRIFQQILSIAMLILFLYVGMGFNVYDYCCESCANAGSSVFTTTSCEEVHHNHHCTDHHCHHVPATEPIPADCDSYSSHSDHCSVERYTITQTYTSVRNVVAPAVLEYFALSVSEFGTSVAENNTTISYFAKIPPPLPSGRDILLASAILII